MNPEAVQVAFKTSEIHIGSELNQLIGRNFDQI